MGKQSKKNLLLFVKKTCAFCVWVVVDDGHTEDCVHCNSCWAANENKNNKQIQILIEID